MSLIHNDVKNKTGDDSWGTFVQKVITEEAFHYVQGEEISVYLISVYSIDLCLLHLE